MLALSAAARHLVFAPARFGRATWSMLAVVAGLPARQPVSPSVTSSAAPVSAAGHPEDQA